MKDKLKSYVESRLNHLIDTIDGFEKEVRFLESSMQEDQIKIKELKKKNKDLKAEDVKDDMLSVNKRFYRMSLIDQNIRNIACSITELSILSDALGVELDLTEERSKVFEIFKEDNRDLFIFESGEVKPIEPKEYEKLEAQVIERASTKQSLENNFELI